MSRTRAHSPGVKAAILASKLWLWNSLCTTEPTLLEVIKWVSKVHYAHIQLDDEVTSNIVYWAMKSRTGSVDAYPIPCNPQFQLQQTNHSQDLWHQVDLLRYRVNKQRFLTPGHQGWNDLHRLCRIGMEYYLPNNDNNTNNTNNTNYNNNNNNDNNNNDNNNNNYNNNNDDNNNNNKTMMMMIIRIIRMMTMMIIGTTR